MYAVAVVLMFILLMIGLLAYIVRRIYLSFLDPCPEDNCKGHLHFRGDVMTAEGKKAHYGCDRCPFETLEPASSDAMPAI